MDHADQFYTRPSQGGAFVMKGRPGHGNQSLMKIIFKYRKIHECVHQSGIYTQVVEVSEIERVTQLVMIMHR